VPASGGKPKKVFKPFRGPRTVNYQISISPDGNKIAFSSVKDDEQYIYSIPVEGGNPIKLASMEAREPVYSPDGKMIAFAADREIGRGEGDLGLWVVPSEGGTPHLVANANKATSPIWSPDGKMIAYSDEEQPRMSIARIDKTGQAIGIPVSIDAPEGTSFIHRLAGWTPDNKIGILLVTEQESAIYTLPVQGGQAAMIQYTPGAFIYQPRWSRDGKQVFYSAPPEEVNLEGVPYTWTIIASVSASGGNGKTVPCDLNDKNIRLFQFGGGHRVSPDGKTMIAGAWTPEDVSSEYYFPKARIWKLALDGTRSTQITKTKGPFMDTDPCWSSDGGKIAFIRHRLNKGKRNPIPIADQDVYMVNSAGGEPELLDSVPGKSIQSLVWSPDGKMLACLVKQEESPVNRYIYIINIKTREKSKFYKVEDDFGIIRTELAWSPDNKRIAFNFNDDAKSGIKVMTLSDGRIEEIKTGLTDLDGINHLDWSPDGARFAFIGSKVGKIGFWFLEDFLSELK
jgi:Tol biopolymer transport system component